MVVVHAQGLQIHRSNQGPAQVDVSVGAVVRSPSLRPNIDAVVSNSESSCHITISKYAIQW